MWGANARSVRKFLPFSLSEAAALTKGARIIVPRYLVPMAAPSAVSSHVSAPICDPRDKRALHVNTGAIAVDMESHVVAAVGAAHGLPVAAMRVVTDPAERTLPASAVAAMRPNGTTNIGAMIRAMLMRPREIPALFQTAFDALAARATLVRGRRLLGPGLLLVNSLEGEPVTANEPYLGPAIQTATMESV